MVDEKTISPTEAWLWSNINSFQEKGYQCFMSNAVLGECVGLKKRQAQNAINHLEELGLVAKSEGVNDKGEKCRILTCLYPTPLATHCYPPSNTVLAPPSSPLPHKDTNRNKTLSERQKPHRTVCEVKEVFINLATSLADAIGIVRNIKYSPTTLRAWARQIQLLHSADGAEIPRIKRGMRWYVQNLPKYHRDRYFVQIYSGTAFREKFFDKLESAMLRYGTDVQGVELGAADAAPKVRVITRDVPEGFVDEDN
jgi:hypothetical protein